MARFYGTIQGARGPASRLGHKSSGLEATAQSHNGDVVVRLEASTETDEMDDLHVMVRRHGGGQRYLTLYSGSFGALCNGGKMELFRFLLSTATPEERHELAVSMAHEGIHREFGRKE